MDQLKVFMLIFWRSGAVWRATNYGILKYFWILPCLSDLRKGSNCRKTSCKGWPKQDHSITVSEWKLMPSSLPFLTRNKKAEKRQQMAEYLHVVMNIIINVQAFLCSNLTPCDIIPSHFLVSGWLEISSECICIFSVCNVVLKYISCKTIVFY